MPKCICFCHFWLKRYRIVFKCFYKILTETQEKLLRKLNIVTSAKGGVCLSVCLSDCLLPKSYDFNKKKFGKWLRLIKCSAMWIWEWLAFVLPKYFSSIKCIKCSVSFTYTCIQIQTYTQRPMLALFVRNIFCFLYSVLPSLVLWVLSIGVPLRPAQDLFWEYEHNPTHIPTNSHTGHTPTYTNLQHTHTHTCSQ